MATSYRCKHAVGQSAPFGTGHKNRVVLKSFLHPRLCLDTYAKRIEHGKRGGASMRARAMLEDSETGDSWLSLPLKHVIESQQFGKDALEVIFKVSREMEDVRPNSDASRQLQGAVMSTLFYEPSTRTRLSFESAMIRLGGSVLSTESAGEYSSAAKGETLEGTLHFDFACLPRFLIFNA
jgi:hypothetical protein